MDTIYFETKITEIDWLNVITFLIIYFKMY